MAENINIKVLIDAADSAKTIQETKKALRDLKTAALQVEEGSQAFQSITTAAGQLQDRIGDLSATTKYLGDDLKNLKGLSSIGQGIAGGFAVAQGAAALFGAENKKVEESILKVQSALALLQGVQAIGEVLQKESAATLFIQNGLRKTAIALTSEQAVATAAEAVAAGTATLAQRALNAAMNANPVMALVAVLGLAVGALFAFSKGSDEAAKAEEKARKETEARTKAIKEEEAAYSSFIGKEQAGYLLLSEQLKNTNPKSQERLDLIKKINETYGTTLKNLQDETLFQNQVNKSVEDYIEFLKLKYALQSNEKLISDNIAKQAKLERDLAKEQASLNESIEARKRAGYKDTGRDLRIALELQYQVVDDLQKQIDAADKRLEGYIKGALASQAKISATGLKVANERVDTETKTNKKVLTEHKEFVADYTSLDETIISNNADIQGIILSTWGDTYAAQLAELDKSMAEQKASVSKGYTDALAEVDAAWKDYVENWNSNEKNIKIALTDTTAYNTFLSNFSGYRTKLELIEQQGRIKTEQIENYYSQKRQELFEEEAKRLKQLLKEATELTLNTDEYNRYLQYVKIKTDQLREELIASNKEAVDLQNQTVLDGLKVFVDRNKDVLELARKYQADISAEDLEDARGVFQAKIELLREFSDDDRLVYDTIQGNQSDFLAKTLKTWDDAYNELGITLAQAIEKMSENDGWKELEGSILDFTKILTGAPLRAVADFGAGLNVLNGKTDEGSMRLNEYIRTLSLVGKLTDEDKQSLNDYSDILDEISTGFTKIKETRSGSIMQNETFMPLTEAQILAKKQEIENILDLYREVSTTETGQNKLLTAVYVDKLSLIQDQEGKISAAILVENQKRILDAETLVKSQEVIVKNAEDAKTKLLANATAEQKAISQKNIDDAKAQLGDFQKLVEDAKKKSGETKSFAIAPDVKDPTQIGLEKLIALYPELSKKLLQAQEERYKQQVDVEDKFYKDAKNQLFLELEQGLITQEQYDKNSETLEFNHQENLLAIDVSYGKKGQDELEKNEAKKRAIIKQGQDEEKASKEKFIQEMVALEAVLQNGIMDMLNFNFQRRIDNLNSEYDYKIGLIQAEKDAYEQSLQEQTVAEIQIATKKQEFQDQIDAQNKQRAAEERQIKLQQFNAQKAADIIQAGINGALAFTKSLAELGPYAIAIQGLIAAQVASQIFFISSQQPAFAEGGLVVGPGGPKDDKINAKLSNGESVINAKSTKMFAPVLSAINQAGGGKAIPSQAGGKMALGGGGTMTVGEKPLVVDNRELIDEIRNLNNRPIETYVSESKITAAQKVSDRENRRTSF